jgi:penicillin-binding protein 2
MIEPISSRRYSHLSVIAIVCFSVLIGKLWFLQVLSTPTFEQAAVGNRTREVFIEARRGQILDINGKVLAGRRESLTVELNWSNLAELDQEERSEIFLEVAHELNLSGVKTRSVDIQKIYDKAKKGSVRSVVVASDVPRRVWVALQERPYVGFTMSREWLRTYPYGNIGAHILGYVGVVRDADQAAELNSLDDSKRYFEGDELGLAGVEKIYDRQLRGTPEHRLVEIAADNRVLSTVEVVQEAKPGDDIRLSIDIDLQYAAELTLVHELAQSRLRTACEDCPAHQGRAGSIVALDVNDGSVTAMASYPTFNPADFLGGLSQAQVEYLFQNPDQPMFNRPISGRYAAGSTFKPFTAYAAIDQGARKAEDIWLDEGSYKLAECIEDERCVFRNAGSLVLGEVDMRDALSRSSDTYFYSLGEELWLERETYGETAIQDVAQMFGLGQATGIDLPSDNAGEVPTPARRIELYESDPDTYIRRTWYTGDNVNLAIGQGDLVVTPLQLANSYAMIANNGLRHQPQVLAHVIDGETGEIIRDALPKVAADESLNPVAMSAIRDGLAGATTAGTAARAFEEFPFWVYPVSGKTGTAQVAGKADYSLFAGFGPAFDPKYAVATVLEEAGFGSDAAAPATRQMFEYLSGLVEVPSAPLATEALPLSVDLEVLAILEEIAREAAEAEAEAAGEIAEVAIGEVTEQP